MVVVGLTGGIASGKSLAAKQFRELGAKIIDADKIVSALYKKQRVRRLLSKNFGKEILTKAGKINREKLAQIVFSNRAELRKLNRLVHPLVFLEINNQLSALKKKNQRLIVVVVPLLFESRKALPLLKKTVVVYCSKEQQLQRLRERNLSRREALARISAQIPLSQKVKMADFAIDNSGSAARTRKLTEKVFKEILGNAP